MIKLRLVGPSADLEHLVYSNKRTGKKGSHLVAIDDDLFDVLEDVVRRRRRGQREEREAARASAPRVESKLAPRDVQRLLRAGRSVEDVAKTAQVPAAWVEQFLGAVLYERAGVVQEVQRAWMSKQRLGESGVPLGEAVEANLRARHVRLTRQEIADAWDATRTDDQPWSVTLRFRFRGREQRATWKYDPAARSVTPANRLAADLGWVSPARRLTAASARPAKPAAETTSAPSKRSVAKKSSGKKTSAKRSAVKKRAATSHPAKKTGARASGAKRTAAKKRTTARRPAAKKRTTARRPAAKKRTTARRPAARRPAAKKRTAARRPAAKKRTTARRPAARRPAAKKRTPVRSATRRSGSRRRSR